MLKHEHEHTSSVGGPGLLGETPIFLEQVRRRFFGGTPGLLREENSELLEDSAESRGGGPELRRSPERASNPGSAFKSVLDEAVVKGGSAELIGP